jgi:hypothetical protein
LQFVKALREQQPPIDALKKQNESFTDLHRRNVRGITISDNQQIKIFLTLLPCRYIISIPDAFGLNENFKEKITQIK